MGYCENQYILITLNNFIDYDKNLFVYKKLRLFTDSWISYWGNVDIIFLLFDSKQNMATKRGGDWNEWKKQVTY